MTRTDNSPILWVQALGIDRDERDDLAHALEGAVGEEYHVVVASEPVELIGREELLEALGEGDDP